ncbi:MAG TPA: DUF4476 domain-containing protein [Flavisolibacter sp.]
MKNLVLVVSFIVCSVCASAQKVYFIYLQADNYSPFYVKMNDKIFSSTTSGYLILSSLVDSTYGFSIGFPSSQPESRFKVTLGGKDRGFLIKNFDTGLGLFDLQTLTITQSIKDDSPKDISYVKRNDEFASLLSKAANDTTLLYAVVRIKTDDVVVQQQPSPKQAQAEEKQKVEEKPVAKDSSVTVTTGAVVSADAKKEDATGQANTDIKKDAAIIGVTAAVVSQKDSTLTAKDQVAQPIKETVIPIPVDSAAEKTAVVEAATDSVNKVAVVTPPADTTTEVVFKRSQVKKYSESSNSEGFGLVFFDKSDSGQDTIRLVIPNPPLVFQSNKEGDSSDAQKGFIHVEDLKTDTHPDEVKKDVQETRKEANADQLKKEADVTPPIVVAVKSDAALKAHCKSVASNNDFFKLRKNMASENSDEAMVDVAKKVFKSKCFTTEQLKNLSALFLTSAGKYEFFDAAYSHVSDQQNFASLESEIKDDYYLKRFRALIGD